MVNLFTELPWFWHTLFNALKLLWPNYYWYIYIYILTPWCRVLLEKLTGLQLVKKLPAFHGTRRFITALTSVRHLSLSWASPIQSTYPHPTSWRSFLILSTHLCLGLPSGLFPSGFPTKTLYTPLSSPMWATCPAHIYICPLSNTKTRFKYPQHTIKWFHNIQKLDYSNRRRKNLKPPVPSVQKM